MPSGIEDKFPLVCMIANTHCETPLQRTHMCKVPTWWPSHSCPGLPRVCGGPNICGPLSWAQHFALGTMAGEDLTKIPILYIVIFHWFPQWAAKEQNAKALGSFPLWTCEPVLLTPVRCFAISLCLTSTRGKAFSVMTLLLPNSSGPQSPEYKNKVGLKVIKKKVCSQTMKRCSFVP